MENPSILNSEDMKFFDKMVFKDNGKTLNHILSNPNNTTFFFNKGFVSFNTFLKDGDGYDNDLICDLLIFFKTKDSKLKRDFLLKGFWNFLRLNGCTKVNMHTKINPKFWENNYGFKILKYEMELDL
tara:strand:- start:161 stop:541 length:381 start_codon:yes stop_codon:yes gene_type:complete